MTDLMTIRVFIKLLFSEAFRKIGLQNLFKSSYNRIIISLTFILGYIAFFYINIKQTPPSIGQDKSLYLILFTSYITTTMIISISVTVFIILLFRVSDTIYYIINTFPIKPRQVAVGIILFKLFISTIMFLFIEIVIWSVLVLMYKNIISLLSLVILGISIHLLMFSILICIDQTIDRCFSKLRNIIKAIFLQAIILITYFNKFTIDEYLSLSLSRYSFSELNFNYVFIYKFVLIALTFTCLITLYIHKSATVYKYYKTSSFWISNTPFKCRKINLFKKVNLALIREKKLFIPLSLVIITIIISVLMRSSMSILKSNVLSSLSTFIIIYLYYINSTTIERTFDRLYRINNFLEVLYIQASIVLLAFVMYYNKLNDLLVFIYLSNAVLFAGLLFPKSKSTINEVIAIIMIIAMFISYSALNQNGKPTISALFMVLILNINIYLFNKLSYNHNRRH